MTRDWLRERRLEKQLTLQEIAKEVGVSWQSLSYYETGERTPSVPTAKRIGAFLGFDWAQFYEDDKKVV